MTTDVDFTMMYAAHDAFTRDLERMLAACARGVATTAPSVAGWTLFTEQLHVHHTAEDAALWPPLRSAVTGPSEIAVLDAMEAEHAQLDPLLERARAALDAGDETELAGTVALLSTGLRQHMQHEEQAALPLIADRLGAAGWQEFTEYFRRTPDLQDPAVFFPWLLDDAPEATVKQVLGVLPAPVRVLYRTVWAPRYQRAGRWSPGGRVSAPYRTRPALPPRS